MCLERVGISNPSARLTLVFFYRTRQGTLTSLGFDFTDLDPRSLSTDVLALLLTSADFFLGGDRLRAEFDFLATLFDRTAGASRRFSSSEDVSESLSLLFFFLEITLKISCMETKL